MFRVSITITDFSWAGGPATIREELSAVARAADAAGVDTLWVSDHLLQASPTSAPDSEMLEAYATLGFLAARTERVRLGAMVSPVTYREPALLIKAATTLDVLAGGRAWLGLGAGYHEDEARAMGLSLPPTRERFDRLEETLRLARQMWAGDASPFHGAHYDLERPVGNPRPLGRDRLPVLIGGMGERRTLPLVARYGDACNLFDIPDGGATVRHKLQVLRGACDTAGRAYADVEKTISTRAAPGGTAAFVAQCTALAELGIEHAVLLAPERWTADDVTELAPAIAAVAALEPAG